MEVRDPMTDLGPARPKAGGIGGDYDLGILYIRRSII